MAHQQRPNEGLRTDSATDEYGNPVVGHGGTTGAGYAGGLGDNQGGQHATTGTGGGFGTGGMGTEKHGQEGRRTGSDSSSSSEDDGEGGRRKKKGLTGRIKEKLPGGKGRGEKTEEPQPQMHSSTTTAPGGESKGLVEKIKEKLPGGHHP